MESEIQFFVNEYSLQEQFFDISEFEKAVIKLLLMISYIGEMRIKNRLFKSMYLFVNFKAIRNEDFRSTLNRMTQKDIRENFKRILFDRNNPANWQDDQKHSSNDIYVYESKVVTETSMAELAERKLLNSEIDGALLNFEGSSLQNGEPATVKKKGNDSETVQLDSFIEKETLNQWMKGIHPREIAYSFDSTEPPTDEQTVLKDSFRFQSTNKLCQGRRIYEELTTGKFWYVDNLHCGDKSHLEVFDKRGNHLGEASMEGKFVLSTKKKDKNIKGLI